MDHQSDLAVVLASGDLEITGRLVAASNGTYLCSASLDGVDVDCVYKPRRGERPLWDFPTGTLGNREVAAFEVSEAAGWSLVPLTVWRENGPMGAGMCQAWVDIIESERLCDVVPTRDVPPGWRRIVDGYDAQGDDVTLIHADDPALRAMAVFDAVINNADRKGGHILCGPEGRTYAVDHGVGFNVDDKLRTVLWGWAGELLDGWLVDSLSSLRAALGSDRPLWRRLSVHLSPQEIDVTRERATALLRSQRFPEPGDGWPALPWPAF